MQQINLYLDEFKHLEPSYSAHIMTLLALALALALASVLCLPVIGVLLRWENHATD